MFKRFLIIVSVFACVLALPFPVTSIHASGDVVIDENIMEFDNNEDAGNYVRQQLINREENIVYYFTRPMSSPTLPANTGQAIYDMARAYDGGADPKAGDYLEFQNTYNKVKTDIVGAYNNKYYYKITYTSTYVSTKEQEDVVDAEVQRILTELNVYDKTDYEKIKAVYDYLCKTIVYDRPMTKYSVYSALIEKTSVCQGYGLAMYRLLAELGVPVRYVYGDSNKNDTTETVPHGWNIVKVNGKWYHIDATWGSLLKDLKDDENNLLYGADTVDYTWFLKSQNDWFYHNLDTEIFNAEFFKEYPIEKTDSYGEDLSNTIKAFSGNWQFQNINDDQITNEYDKKTTVYIFYRNNWVNSNKILKEMVTSSYYGSNNAIFYAMEIGRSDAAALKETAKTTGFAATNMIYETTNGLYNLAQSWLEQANLQQIDLYRNYDLPLIIVTDANKNIQYVNVGLTSSSKVDKEIAYILNFVPATEKGSQPAPKGLTYTAPLYSGNTNGTIKNVSEAMEYRKEGEIKYKPCTSNEILYLGEGLYFVRYKETATKKASEETKVLIAPAAPRGQKAELTAFNKPVISWSAVTGADEYEVYRSTGETSGYSRIAVTKNTIYYDTKIPETGIRYYYKIKAVIKRNDMIARSAASGYAGRTPSKNPQLTLESVNFNTPSSAQLTWNAVSEAEGFEVYRSQKKDSGFSRTGITTGNEFVDKNVSAYQSYYYKVKAYTYDQGNKIYLESDTKQITPALSFARAAVEVNVGDSASLGIVTNDTIVSVTAGNTALVKISGTSVKGLKAGNTYVTVKTAKGFTAKVLVKVVSSAVVESIKINYTEKTITLGSSFQFKTTITPSNATTNVSWRTGNGNIASVDANGKVTARNIGNTYLYAKTTNGKEAKCLIKVNAPAPDSISVRYSEKTIMKGEKFTFVATFKPTNAASKVTWRTGNSNVAVVDANGVVTAKNTGNTYLYAKTANGKEAKCLIKVKAPAPKGLSIRYTEKTITKGSKFTFNAVLTPADAVTTITWRTGNTNVAIVDANGVVTAKNTGNTYLYAKTANGIEVKCLLKIK